MSISKTTLCLLGQMTSQLSSNPQVDFQMMATNLKLSQKLVKRAVTKIQLERLLRIGVGINEVEQLAKKIISKKDDNPRDPGLVKTILRKRLNDASKEEYRARKEYIEDKNKVFREIKPKKGKERLMWLQFRSIQRQNSQSDYKSNMERVRKKIQWLKNKYLVHEGGKSVPEELEELKIKDNQLSDLEDKFGGEEDSVVKEVDIDFNENEKKVLKMDPKERLFSKIDVEEQRVETEMMLTQLRWNVK